MRTLKPNELREFTSLVQLDQNNLKATVLNFLEKAGYKKIINTSEYIVAEGKIPIALVAHLDTVFVSSAEEVYYDNVKNVLWSPEGLGADDRAGVYAIIKILLSGLRPHVIFTTDEEVGGVGAAALAKTACPFEKLQYIIELDRRGINDCVFYDCDNKKFTKYVESFGFIEAIGSFSDISEICPAWGVAGVNLSIGYKNEHSYVETLHVGPFLSTIEKVKKMLKQKDIPYFKYIEVKWNIYNKYYPIGKWQGSASASNKVVCMGCGKVFDKEDVFPVLMKDDTVQYLCSDCAVDRVQWCIYCGEAFEIDENNKDEMLCRDCKEGLMGYGYGIHKNPNAF